jgi:hypothetical protein
VRYSRFRAEEESLDFGFSQGIGAVAGENVDAIVQLQATGASLEGGKVMGFVKFC